jgi:DNA-binding transcriptional ArsR family regulator
MSNNGHRNGPFAALGDPTRRAILRLLRRGEMTAGDIAGQFTISAPSVSHHLGVLTAGGLVKVRKDGARMIYSLDTTVIEDLATDLLALVRPEEPHEE